MCNNFIQNGKGAWNFGIIGDMANTLYGYWSGHPCSVGEADPNVAEMPIIEAEQYAPDSFHYLSLSQS